MPRSHCSWSRSGNNIAWYGCDVSKKAEVDACAKKIREEVSCLFSKRPANQRRIHRADRPRCSLCHQFGDPTMIVNNAGIVQGKKILDLSEEDVNEYVAHPNPLPPLSSLIVYAARSETDSVCFSSHRTVGVNLTSHFWILKAFLPAMIARKSGHVVSPPLRTFSRHACFFPHLTSELPS